MFCQFRLNKKTFHDFKSVVPRLNADSTPLQHTHVGDIAVPEVSSKSDLQGVLPAASQRGDGIAETKCIWCKWGLEIFRNNKKNMRDPDIFQQFCFWVSKLWEQTFSGMMRPGCLRKQTCPFRLQKGEYVMLFTRLPGIVMVCFCLPS